MRGSTVLQEGKSHADYPLNSITGERVGYTEWVLCMPTKVILSTDGDLMHGRPIVMKVGLLKQTRLLS